jgi:hypothetical protein
VSNTARIHVTYVLGILLAVIVILATVKWGAIPELVSYMSFALTVASLLLAALAIGYSIYSNGALTTSLFKIGQSADDISLSSQRVAMAADRLGEKVETIPGMMDGVSRRMEETHALMKGYAERASSTPETKVATKTETQADAKPPQRVVPQGFLMGGSILGNLILLACSLSFKKKTAFQFSQLAEKVPALKQGDYAHGYVVASAAAGVLSFNAAKGVWTISSFNDTIAEELKNVLEAKIGKFEEEVFKTAWKGYVATVYAFFA